MADDRLSVELTVSNSAGKLTVKVGVYELSKIDCAVLQAALAEGLQKAIQTQIEQLTPIV